MSRVKQPHRTYVLKETERGFQDAVIEAARYHGWEHFHVYNARRSPAGFPDLVLAKPGYPILLIELKTETGKLSAEQREWGRILSQAEGCYYAVWRPRDWPLIEMMLGQGQVVRRLAPDYTSSSAVDDMAARDGCHYDMGSTKPGRRGHPRRRGKPA